MQLQLKAGTALPNSAKDHKYGFVGSGGNYELLTVSCLVFLPNDRLGAGEGSVSLVFFVTGKSCASCVGIQRTNGFKKS